MALLLVDRWFDAEVAFGRLPGAVVGIVVDQELVWSRGNGWADVERRAAATPDTLYGICSISKLFTAVAVMMERDAGRLRIDDAVGDHLPYFRIDRGVPDSAPVTIRDLLTHSGGVPRESPHPYWTGPEFAFPTREEIVAGLTRQRMLYPAERYFQYSNLGMALLGQVVEATSGLSYETYVQERILGAVLQSLLRQRVGEQVVGAAVQRAAGDDVVARLADGLDRVGHRRLARGQRQRADAAFERREPLLEHVVGRIHDPAVDVAGNLQVEEIRAVLRAVERVGGGLVDRHGHCVGGGLGPVAGMHATGLESPIGRALAHGGLLGVRNEVRESTAASPEPATCVRPQPSSGPSHPAPRRSWVPGQTGLAAIGPDGSPGRRTGLCFVLLARSAPRDEWKEAADGAALLLTAAGWARLHQALLDHAPLDLRMEDGRSLSLSWTQGAYVSPIDGHVFGEGGDWSCYRRGEPTDGGDAVPADLREAGPGRSMDVVLLTPTSLLVQRTTEADLGAYVQRVEAAIRGQIGRDPAVRLHVRIVLEPGRCVGYARPV